MLHRNNRWLNKKRALLTLVLVGLLLVNGVAWMQVWAMTHYVAEGERTANPEALSLPEKVWTVLSGVSVPRPRNLHTP